MKTTICLMLGEFYLPFFAFYWFRINHEKKMRQVHFTGNIERKK